MSDGPTLVQREVPPRVAWALEAAGVSPLLARLFAARGVRSADELDDSLARLLPPDGLRGAQDAARLLADAIASGTRICVVADYDCDGATACAVALRGLALLGAAPENLRYVVPDRALHGYGLTPAIVDLACAPLAPGLLLTVDNGIASLEGVAHARARGIEVLVTDHHLPALAGDVVVLPDANVIVNPNQPGCGFDSKNLAGVGVMFYVLLALRGELRARGVFGPQEQPQTRCAAGSGRARHRGRCGETRCQQPAPRRPGAEADPRRAHAAGCRRIVRRRRARRGARRGIRLRFCARTAAQRRREDSRT